jgi:hypothetical protein
VSGRDMSYVMPKFRASWRCLAERHLIVGTGAHEGRGHTSQERMLKCEKRWTTCNRAELTHFWKTDTRLFRNATT